MNRRLHHRRRHPATGFRKLSRRDVVRAGYWCGEPGFTTMRTMMARRSIAAR